MDNYNITIDKEDKKVILNAQTPIFWEWNMVLWGALHVGIGYLCL
jgi:hypothetical protein